MSAPRVTPAIVAALLGLSACRSAGPTSDRAAHSPAAAPTPAAAPAQENAMTGPDLGIQPPAPLPAQADRAYFVFAAMAIQAVDAPPAQGLYVAGRIVDGSFVPEGEIAGEGPVGQGAGQPGWVELADGSFHGAMTGRPPFAPYVEGALSNDGGFVPSSRTINR